MTSTRRNFLKATAATAATASIHPFAFAKGSSNNNDDEHDVITQMSNAGYKNFILLNKRNANLYIIQNGEYFLQTPVIYGRKIKGKDLTPSGIFSLTNTYNSASEPIMVFFADRALALHFTVPGREKALLSNNIKDRQLSDGCINTPKPALPIFVEFSENAARNDAQRRKTTLVVIDTDYSSPSFQKALQEFKPQLNN